MDAATDGSDYKGTSMDIIFAAGTINGSIQCMDIPISNTRTVEEDEIFIVTLTSSSSNLMLGNNVTTVIITDIDGTFLITKTHGIIVVLCL